VKYIKEGTEFLDQLKDSVHDLYDENKELKKEIERLNNIINGLDNTIKNLEEVAEHKINIINELEKWCLSQKENDKYCYLASNDKDKCRYDIWEEVLNKLQELKGVDKE